jgi:hypothetical protein
VFSGVGITGGRVIGGSGICPKLAKAGKLKITKPRILFIVFTSKNLLEKPYAGWLYTRCEVEG